MSTPQPSEIAALRESEIAALRESVFVLKFVSESPKDVPAAIAEAITEAWAAEEANQWNPQIASRFWVAYSQLCTLLKPPVSVDNVIANLKPVERPWWMFWPKLTAPKSLSQRTANRYRWLIMALLILAVYLSFIVSATTNLVGENSKLVDQENNIVEKVAPEVDRLQLAVGDETLTDATLSEENRKLFKEILLQFQNLALLHLQVLKNDETITRLLHIFGTEIIPYVRGTLIWQKASDLKGSITVFYQTRIDVAEIRAEAATVTGIITTAILPIVLGMMGACAHVVRTISEQIKDVTFSGAAPIRNLVRVALGALAGVVIGFGGIFTGTGLSSAALSFIAGYAIEPVFEALDSIADKFKRPA